MVAGGQWEGAGGELGPVGAIDLGGLHGELLHAIHQDREGIGGIVWRRGGKEGELVQAALHLLELLGDCARALHEGGLVAIGWGGGEPGSLAGDPGGGAGETPLRGGGLVDPVVRGARDEWPLKAGVLQCGGVDRLAEESQLGEAVGGGGTDGVTTRCGVVWAHLEGGDGWIGGVELEVARVVGLLAAGQAGVVGLQDLAEVVGNGCRDELAGGDDGGSIRVEVAGEVERCGTRGAGDGERGAVIVEGQGALHASLAGDGQLVLVEQAGGSIEAIAPVVGHAAGTEGDLLPVGLVE